MNREWLILVLSVLTILFISGCAVLEGSQDGNFTPEYKDEALRMETEITGRVLPNQIINMKVRLTNQVKDDVENVELRITDFYGLELKSEICADGKKLEDCGFVSDLCGCNFTAINSLDEKEITFVFRVPNQTEIAKIGRTLEPEFTLKYEYHGETNYLLPIIRMYEKSTSAKIQMVKTKGPIHVDIERGFTSSSYEWESNGSEFSVVMRVRDVLDPRNTIFIHRNAFWIYLNDYLILSGEGGICNFNTTLSDQGYYTPDRNLELPMDVPLVCALQAINDVAPWVYGSVRVVFAYEYEVVKTERIDVETIIA